MYAVYSRTSGIGLFRSLCWKFGKSKMAAIAMATDYIYVIFSIVSKNTCSTFHMMIVLYDLDVVCRYAISILKIIIPIVGVFLHNYVISGILKPFFFFTNIGKWFRFCCVYEYGWYMRILLLEKWFNFGALGLVLMVVLCTHLRSVHWTFELVLP